MSLIFWPRFGAGSATVTLPATPTLAVADNGDATGGVATITGSTTGSTNTVYYQAVDGELGTSTWTSAGSRTGNGTVNVDPGDDAYYWWKVVSVTASGSAVSNLVYQNITSGTTAVHYRCLLAAQARIQGLTLSGIANGSIVVQKVPIARESEWGTGRTYAYPGILITPIGSERMSPNEGTNIRDDVGYPVLISIFDADNQSVTANHEKYLKWREKIARAFRNQRLVGVTEIIRTVVEPNTIVDPGKWLGNRFHSALTLRCTSREVRGV